MNEYLTPDQAAALIPGMTKQALAQKRYLGTGPKYLKPGKRVLYRKADVIAWLEASERTWTGEKAA